MSRLKEFAMSLQTLCVQYQALQTQYPTLLPVCDEARRYRPFPHAVSSSLSSHGTTSTFSFAARRLKTQLGSIKVPVELGLTTAIKQGNKDALEFVKVHLQLNQALEKGMRDLDKKRQQQKALLWLSHQDGNPGAASDTTEPSGAANPVTNTNHQQPSPRHKSAHGKRPRSSQLVQQVLRRGSLTRVSSDFARGRDARFQQQQPNGGASSREAAVFHATIQQQQQWTTARSNYQSPSARKEAPPIKPNVPRIIHTPRRTDRVHDAKEKHVPQPGTASTVPNGTTVSPRNYLKQQFGRTASLLQPTASLDGTRRNDALPPSHARYDRNAQPPQSSYAKTFKQQCGPAALLPPAASSHSTHRNVQLSPRKASQGNVSRNAQPPKRNNAKAFKQQCGPAASLQPASSLADPNRNVRLQPSDRLHGKHSNADGNARSPKQNSANDRGRDQAFVLPTASSLPSPSSNARPPPSKGLHGKHSNANGNVQPPKRSNTNDRGRDQAFVLPTASSLPGTSSNVQLQPSDRLHGKHSNANEDAHSPKANDLKHDQAASLQPASSADTKNKNCKLAPSSATLGTASLLAQLHKRDQANDAERGQAAFLQPAVPLPGTGRNGKLPPSNAAHSVQSISPRLSSCLKPSNASENRPRKRAASPVRNFAEKKEVRWESSVTSGEQRPRKRGVKKRRTELTAGATSRLQAQRLYDRDALPAQRPGCSEVELQPRNEHSGPVNSYESSSPRPRNKANQHAAVERETVQFFFSDDDAEPDTIELKVTKHELMMERKNPHSAYSCSWSDAYCDKAGVEYMLVAKGVGQYVRVYRVEMGGSKSTMKYRYSFKDSDDSERFYATEFVGRTGEDHPVLCAGGSRGLIQLITFRDGGLHNVGSLTGHGDEIFDLKVSPVDEWLVLSASKDKSIRLWQLKSRRTIAVFGGFGGNLDAVISVAWHPSGEKFVSGSWDNSIKIWDISHSVSRAIQESHRMASRSVRERQEDDKVCHWSGSVLEQFPVFSTRKVHRNLVDCVEFIGNLIISKSIEGMIRLWAPSIKRSLTAVGTPTVTETSSDVHEVLHSFEYPNGTPYFVRFAVDPARRLLAVGNTKGMIYIWDILADSNAPVRTLKFGRGNTGVTNLKFSPNGSMLVAVTDDGAICLWEVARL